MNVENKTLTKHYALLNILATHNSDTQFKYKISLKVVVTCWLNHIAKKKVSVYFGIQKVFHIYINKHCVIFSILLVVLFAIFVNGNDKKKGDCNPKTK